MLNDIFEDFLSNTSSILDHALCPNKQNRTYSFCEKIQASPRYQVLLYDDVVSARMLEKFSEMGKKSFITHLTQKSLLTFEQAEAVFWFQINGYLAINRIMLKNKYTDWSRIQQTID